MRETQEKQMENQRGITLIALVITIIVLLILAAVAILMLSGENGILNKAAVARLESKKQSAIEKIKLAYLASLIDGYGKVDYQILNKELEDVGYDRGQPNNEGIYTNDIKSLPADIEINGERVILGEDGNVESKVEWYYTEDKTKITNGKKTLKVGDIVKYDASIDGNGKEIKKEYTSFKKKNGWEDQYYTSTSYKGEWRILGIDKNGNIEIMSTKNITTPSMSDGYFYLNGKEGAQYGVREIKEISSIYGYGKGAFSARAIEVEDIDKITGYIKENFQKNTLIQYGNDVTYYWTTTKAQIKAVGNNKITEYGTSNAYQAYGFNWYNDKADCWQTSYQDVEEPTEITTVKNTLYYYDVSSGEYYNRCKAINNGKLYDLLFKDTKNGQYYWLASPFVYAYNIATWYGVRGVVNQTVNCCKILPSDYPSGKGANKCGIRPVVKLNSNITFGGNSECGWTIDQV